MSEASRAWVRALTAVSGLAEAGRTLPQRLPGLAERFGPRFALISESGSLTYDGLAARASQYGRWAQQHGLRLGEVVWQISRLKTIKRTMCGRAGFELLRHRVLQAA